MALPPWLIITGGKLMFKWLKRKSLETARGKLTYTSLAAMLLPIVSTFAGIEIVPADVEPIYQGVLAALALFGRWRATK